MSLSLSIPGCFATARSKSVSPSRVACWLAARRFANSSFISMSVSGIGGLGRTSHRTGGGRPFPRRDPSQHQPPAHPAAGQHVPANPHQRRDVGRLIFSH